MISRTLLAIALLGCSTAFAATPSAKAQYKTDAKKAALQYTADKKSCAGEVDANARLQCRRDAKAVYDLALRNAQAKLNATAASTAGTPSTSPSNAASPAPDKTTAVTHGAAATQTPVCADCGTVSAVSVLEKDGQGTPLGVIAGGLGGAILGHQVGGGIGKDMATVAGAVGGAYAGKMIEEKARAYKVWSVTVQYPDSSSRSFEFKEDPQYRTGDPVKNAGDSIKRR